MGTPFEESKSRNNDGNQNALNKIIERRSRMDQRFSKYQNILNCTIVIFQYFFLRSTYFVNK